MTKSNLTAAVAAILMATSPLAYAQSATATHETSAAVTSPVGAQIQSDQVRASKMLGSTVYDVQNRDIGSVKDLIIDKDGRVAAAVVDVGTFLGMGGKYVAVPLSAIKTDNNRLTLDMTKEQLQQAEAYNLTNNNTGSGSTTSPVTGGHLGSASGTNR
ncbi:MAG TPA: PRC-barrel domain-containing protein [Stellaceae bacterium]|nr:PRC-barrel domain-containing protein [Stellaceae bacterium]